RRWHLSSRAGNLLCSAHSRLGPSPQISMIPSSRTVLRMGLEIMCHSAQAMVRLAPTEDTRIAWRELLNKVEAFTCFTYADQLNRETLDPYHRLWMTEGLGYTRAETALKGRVLDADLIPLHTGMGLALACRAMQ